MDLNNGNCYWIRHSTKKILKDLYMIIDDYNLKIKDVIKIT